MLKSITRIFRVAAMAILAALLLAAGLTAVSAQAFKPRSETRAKACNAKYDECLKSCKTKDGCKGKCGVDLIACGEAAETPAEKEENKARMEKENAEMQKAAAKAAKFECAGRGKDMVIYATNKTERTLKCWASCNYIGGDKKNGDLGCRDIVVGPNSLRREVCAHGSSSQPPPPFEITSIGSECH